MDPYRIIHTADWHLGRRFHGVDLSSLQAEFLEWLAELAAVENADAILMAGDIYDRALPPVPAVEVFRTGLTRLAEQTDLVLITGNHDSAPRMSLGDLMRPEIALRAGPARIGEPVLIDRGGAPAIDHGSPALAVYPIPYLDPIVDAVPLGADEQSHEAVLTAALERCRKDLAERPAGTRSIVIAHAFVAGGSVSESERTLAVGGAEQVPAGLFGGFDYIALGHLHRPQEVAPGVVYSGSPIPYSFSEVDRRDRSGKANMSATSGKSVEILELGEGGSVDRRRVEVPVFKPIARVEGELQELLSSSEYAGYEDHWLEITLTDESRPHNPMDRLRTRFPHTLSLQFTHDPVAETEDGRERLERLTETDPYRLTASFIEHVRGTAPEKVEEELLRKAVAAGLSEEGEG